jgi:holo-[acyl-carrier protein] synthase
MVGIDIIETKRIKNLIEKYGQKFLKKIFTPNEIAYCERQKLKEQNYAARFAVKEAVAKVIKEGPSNFWQDIEIGKNPNGAPFLILSKRLSKICPQPIEISLSHCDEYAVGIAIKYNGSSL